MKDLANYLSSYNNATQAVALHTSGSSPLIKWTGTAQAIVNGVHVANLAAQTSIDMSDDAIAMDDPKDGTPLAGRIFADEDEFWFLVTTEADGTPHVYLASVPVVLADTPAILKIPAYAPTELCIAYASYKNNALTTSLTWGGGNLYDADDEWTQLVGPNLLPHPELWDKN
jgi:hypothetical protein